MNSRDQMTVCPSVIRPDYLNRSPLPPDWEFDIKCGMVIYPHEECIAECMIKVGPDGVDFVASAQMEEWREVSDHVDKLNYANWKLMFRDAISNMERALNLHFEDVGNYYYHVHPIIPNIHLRRRCPEIAYFTIFDITSPNDDMPSDVIKLIRRVLLDSHKLVRKEYQTLNMLYNYEDPMFKNERKPHTIVVDRGGWCETFQLDPLPEGGMCCNSIDGTEYSESFELEPDFSTAELIYMIHIYTTRALPSMRNSKSTNIMSVDGRPFTEDMFNGGL